MPTASAKVRRRATPTRSSGAAPAASVEAYLAKVPAGQRAALQKLRRTIRSAAPRSEEVISYGMPGYKLAGYLCGFAAFKEHCSFFTGTALRGLGPELRGYATAKGTIRFKPEHPLPEDLVRRIVKARVAENRARRAPERAEAKRRSR